MKLVDEFKAFALKGNVLDLAVGVIIGGAFGKIVSSLVNDIVMPPFGFVLQGIDFKNLRWVLQRGADGSVVASVNYGNFLQNLVEFLIVGFSIFFMVKALSTLKKRFEKQKAEEVAATPISSEEVQLLREIRDLLRK
jgi:large conductance mechanosensitive channel